MLCCKDSLPESSINFVLIVRNNKRKLYFSFISIRIFSCQVEACLDYLNPYLHGLIIITELSSFASPSNNDLGPITKRGTLSNYNYTVNAELLHSGLKECLK